MAYRLAALVMGLAVGAYWLRVLRMARKARKKTGRAANFLPPEMVGRVLRVVWIPVVVVWVAHPFFTAAVRSAPVLLQPIYSSAWIAWPAAVCAGACLWASRVCWKTMGKNWRMGIDPKEQNTLVVAGPYAYVRHPIYAGMTGLVIASAIVIARWWAAPIAIGLQLAGTWVRAREEDRLLREAHGEAFKAYAARVPGILPKI